MVARVLRLCLVLPIAGAVALFPAGTVNSQQPDAVDAAVVNSVEKPRPAKRSIQKSGRAAKISSKRVARRPVKAKPQAKRPAPSRTNVTAPASPNDPLWSSSWSLAKTNVSAAWNLTPGVSETVVAVLDSGVDLTHPDLRGSFVAGYDVVNRDEDPSDDLGHGTMVAGVLAARANNGLGGAGACSGCSLMPVKVIAANGSGSASDIAEGIRWATDHGADVVNMSFTLSGPDEGVAQAIAYAQGNGVLVVAAAGNAGSADVTYPAGYPGVVGVAGTDAADVRYDWSSFGGWVGFAAPGCSVSTASGGGYGEFCGTSSATAFASGVAGLVRSFAPTLPPAAIEQVLSSSALRVGEFVSAGRIDAGAALASVKAASGVALGKTPVQASESLATSAE